MISDRTQATLKIVVVGDDKVGKSSFIQRYVNDYFNGNKITYGQNVLAYGDICVARIDKTVLIGPQAEIKLQFYDVTKNTEKSHTPCGSPFRYTNTVIIMFDFTDLRSLENVEKWYYWVAC